MPGVFARWDEAAVDPTHLHETPLRMASCCSYPTKFNAGCWTFPFSSPPHYAPVHFNFIARILNRPLPQLPSVYLSEEEVNELAEVIRVRLNKLFSVSSDIALAKDSYLFFRAASVMLLISLVGSLTDLITFGYISLIVTFTVPALYEKYEDHVDGFLFKWLRMFQELNVRLHNKVQRLAVEIQKLC